MVLNFRKGIQMAQKHEKTAADLFGKGETPTDTRDRLIHTAMNLFYIHGIHAVGLDRVIAEVGVTKTTFYNHFESKDQLICDVLRKRSEWEFQSMVEKVDEIAGGDPCRALLAFFDVLHAWFTEPEFRGCQFINAAVEFPSPNDPVHQIAAEHARRTFAQIAEFARRAEVDDPEGLAEKWGVLFEGAITMRQVAGRNDAARVARGVAERLLADHLAPAT